MLAQIHVLGGIIYWTLNNYTSYPLLQQTLAKLHLSRFMPELRTPYATLRDTLRDLYTPDHYLIRPLIDKDGFAVVQEDKGEDSNNYDCTLVVKLTNYQQELDFSSGWDQTAKLIQARYQDNLTLLPAATMASCLVHILLKYLNGIKLRPSGGVYWLAEKRLSYWHELTVVVNQCLLANKPPHSFYLLRHQRDPEAITAIHQALQHDIETETQDIKNLIFTNKLGQQALQSKQEQLQRLRKKVQRFATILELDLQTLQNAISKVEIAVGQATLAVASGERD